MSARRGIAILSPNATLPLPSEDLLASVLREIGDVEGRNLIIERQYADGKADRLLALASDLVRRAPDVIVAVGTGAVQACQQATKTILIVMGFGADSVARSFDATLARPGGNITGVACSPDDGAWRRSASI